MGLPIRQLIENLKKIEDGLDQVLRDSASIMAQDAKSLAERIIKDKGFGARYSTKKVPAFFFYGKELNAKGKSYIDNLIDTPTESKEIEDGTNWGEFRNAQGLQTNHVDLAYSTRMWKGMRPDEPQKEGSRYFCFMGHNDREGANKMNWNFARYGDFLGKALDGQEDILREVAEENIKVLLDELMK